MRSNLEIALGTIGFVLAVMSPFIINRVLKFKLEIEKMRQETEIRKEEIRAKNQIDIEKMIAEERNRHIHIYDAKNTEEKAGRADGDYTSTLKEEAGRERLKY